MSRERPKPTSTRSVTSPLLAARAGPTRRPGSVDSLLLALRRIRWRGMDLSASTLFAGFFVSTVGFGLFLYGKREARVPQLLAGIGMMILPCCGVGALLTFGLGASLVLALVCATRMGL